MKKAKTLSIVIPFRNWPIGPFEVALKSLEMQTQPVDEVILVDIASDEPFRNDMETLCTDYGVSYYYIPLNLPDKAIQVHLWNTCFNYGIRKVTTDLVMYSGLDRVYENNMVECVLDYYNWSIEQGKEGYFCGKVYNLYRTPKLSELNDFDALIDEATWRGGYGYWGSSTEWFHKVRGLDETIRWYEDLDITRRAVSDGCNILWVSHGGKVSQRIGKCSRVLHLADHPKLVGKRAGPDGIAVAQRGKFRYGLSEDVIRNGEDWGIVTEKKIAKALRLLNLNHEEIKELQDKGENPLDYPGL